MPSSSPDPEVIRTLSAILMAAAMGILLDAWRRFDEVQLPPGALALWAAGLSIAIKEILFRITVRTGRRHTSPMVIANAWHHRPDAVAGTDQVDKSNPPAVGGLGGHLAADPVARQIAAGGFRSDREMPDLLKIPLQHQAMPDAAGNGRAVERLDQVQRRII